MARRGRSGLRGVLLLLIILLAAAEVLTLVLLLQSQEQSRERWVADMRLRFPGIRPQLEATLDRDGPSALLAEARRLLAPTVGATLLDFQGHLLASDMDEATRAGLPALPRLDRLRSWEIVAVGPTTGTAPRVVAFAAINRAGRAHFLGVVRAADGLARDLSERHTALLVHGLCLVLAVFVALTAALLGRREEIDLGSAGAMGAYEEAMARLRQRGDEASRVHAEELRHLRETVRDREAMARAGELTAGIVHEVRNGLSAIVGFARLIEGRVEVGSESAEMVRGLIEEARTLEGVIRRIVEFVRNEELRPSDVDLKRLLERVVARETRARPGAQTSVEIVDGLSLVADEDLIERAFENLVRNARDAAGASGTVVVEGHSQGEEVVVRIRDDGPGMPPELAEGPKPFVTTKRGGLGLGLAIALKILTLHEGRLALRPNRPRGLVAEVVLPHTALAGSLPLVADETASAVAEVEAGHSQDVHDR